MTSHQGRFDEREREKKQDNERRERKMTASK
jgi:hypothetical protein